MFIKVFFCYVFMKTFRGYRGFVDVYSYLIENPEKFEGKSRSWLFRNDEGLYRMLKRCYFSDNGESLLEWFFPDADERLVERGRKFGRGERELSEEEIREVTIVYEQSGGSPYEAHRLCQRHSVDTYVKYWKREGLEVKRIRKSKNWKGDSCGGE